MKSLIMIISLCFTGTFFTSTTGIDLMVSEKTESITNAEKPIITVVFDIGRKKKDCKGFGVCKISIELGLSINDLAPNSGIGEVTNLDGRLQLIAPVEQMHPELLKRGIFSEKGFVVEEAYEIPNNIVEELELQQTVIEKGIYEVSTEGEAFIVNF